MRSAIFMAGSSIARAILKNEMSLSMTIMTAVFLIVFLAMDMIEFIKNIHE